MVYGTAKRSANTRDIHKSRAAYTHVSQSSVPRISSSSSLQLVFMTSVHTEIRTRTEQDLAEPQAKPEVAPLGKCRAVVTSLWLYYSHANLSMWLSFYIPERHRFSIHVQLLCSSPVCMYRVRGSALHAVGDPHQLQCSADPGFLYFGQSVAVLHSVMRRLTARLGESFSVDGPSKGSNSTFLPAASVNGWD
jgi:hypothetical protein